MQRYFRQTNSRSTGSPLRGVSAFILLLVYSSMTHNGRGLETPLQGGLQYECSYVWDPGRMHVKLGRTDVNSNQFKNGRSIFTWRTKTEINKVVHILNGNREGRGKGMTCLYWNKGPSLLVNKQDDILSAVRDHKPHVFGLISSRVRV